MVHFVIQWDLPDQKANLTIYANKAKNDWLPTTLSYPGVIEIRNYRNPLEVTSPDELKDIKVLGTVMGGKPFPMSASR